MAQCPKCKTELEDNVSTCFVCGSELGEDGAGWVIIGSIEDKISADFAAETLSAYGIQAVVFSRSGYFGTAGLPLNPFYGSGSAAFEVSVPAADAEEAAGILDMTLGKRWTQKED